MNRHLTSQAGSTDNKFNGSSRQLTLNITSKDLNIEATKIVRKALLRDNVKTSREEKDVYLSGPYFPCEEYRLKKRLKNNSHTLSQNEKFTNNGRSSKAEKSSFVEIMITGDKSNLTEQGEPGKMKVSESYESFTLSKTKVPILSVSDLTDEKSSKLSEEKQTKTTEECLQQGTSNHESEDTKLFEERKVVTTDPANSRRPSSNVDLEINSVRRDKNLEIAKDKQSVTITAEGTANNQDENAKLSEEKRNLPSSRRSCSRLEGSPGSTTPLFEKGRESLLSNVSNENKTSPNHTKNNHISASTDPFSLENILNPLLRESLKKILNPQCYVESDDTEDNATQMVARDGGTIFKDDILLPKIKRRLVKYQSLDYDEQDNSARNDSLRPRDKYRKNSRKNINMEQSPELSSTKCTGIVVSPSRPVRMLSAGSQYAVKGVIGQWLKRRSGNTVQCGRAKTSAEKQETYREVQLLRVGLSMRMLAGIV